MARIDVQNTGHTEKQEFGYTWLPKKFHTPLKPPNSEPSRKVSLSPAKLGMLLPAHLYARELATCLLPLIDPGLKPIIQNSSQYEKGWGERSTF